MIVTCPSCDAKYRADPQALARRGGRVRCASCSHVWTVDDDALTLEQPFETGAPAPEPVPEEPKKPHEVIRERAESRRRQARLATEGAGWAAVAALFVVIMAGAWLFRVDVVQAFPRAANVYASVGMTVNPHGLEVHELVVERIEARGTPAPARQLRAATPRAGREHAPRGGVAAAPRTSLWYRRRLRSPPAPTRRSRLRSYLVAPGSRLLPRGMHTWSATTTGRGTCTWRSRRPPPCRRPPP